MARFTTSTHDQAGYLTTDPETIQAMVEHPKLIQRPIVINDGKAALGRPPEAVLEIVE